ncbi:9451_t:CDS:2 [Entrophospora sp. SA101]|nr:9451_t:CDS:2 [Entrophospora sp. SA101]
MTFPTFRQTVLALNKEKYFNTDNVILGIREHLDLTGNQLLFLFLHNDEFQTIFDFKGWKADMKKDINGNPKGIFKGILYNVGRFMIGNPNLSFIQPFLSGTAPQSVIRQREPTMYTFEFVNCSLLKMQSRIDIMKHFANSKGFPLDVWSMQEQMYFLLCDTGGLPRAIECLLKCCFGKRYEITEIFFQGIDLLDYNAIHNNLARDVDNMYTITTWVIEHNELAEAIIYRCLAAMPSMKSNILSVKYSDTLESLEHDQHLILTDYAENDNRILITLPPIFIHLYIQALKLFVVVGKLSVSFLPGWKMEWHDFEILVAEYGAYGDKMSLETEQGEIVDFKSGVIVNGDKASFADSFLVFEKSELIVCIQNKLWRGYFKKADVKEEHNKNVAAVQSAHCNFGINNYNVITVFISSADFKEDISGYCEEPLPNCLIIYRHNFEDFFGHILSCRAAMQISRERNPNFTPPDCWLSVSILGIREHLDLTGNQLLFLFLHNDEFQTIFDFKGWKADMKKDINGNPKGIFKGILYNVGRFMIGNPNLSFIQPFLSGTAPQSVIRQREPTMYTFEFVNCSLLKMQSRIDIMKHFANSKGFPLDVWSMQEQMYFLLCDTGGLPRAIECLLKCCFGKRYEITEIFFQGIDLLDYNAIHNNLARDVDNMYTITTWVIEHNELAEAIIYRCLAAMPSMKSNILSVKYSDTLESLEHDQHLILTDYAENDNPPAEPHTCYDNEFTPNQARKVSNDPKKRYTSHSKSTHSK